MVFIISKISTKYGKEHKLYYLVNNYRVGNKIKRQTLLRLRNYSSLNDLLKATEQNKIRLINKLNKRIQTSVGFEKYEKVPFIWGGTKPLLKKKLCSEVKKAQADLNECQREIIKIKSFL